ncbi:MAG: hypothetical protein LUC98_08685 [Lachnospiraceae bacterium]|nr:hypothetical protein [Lachnospiraceae bacterium]
MTTQEQIFLVGVEMVDILERTTPERFGQYKKDFMEQVADHPGARKFIEAVFDIAEKGR